jgi:toxin ParE1/3/4
MPELVSLEAEEDVFQIWLYLLGEANIVTANRIEAELLETFESLAQTPGKGHRRSDLTAFNVFFYTLYQYMIVYQIGPPVRILGVFHGKRDIKRILGDRF